MREIRAAIVGCGKVGHLHAAAYGALPGVRLVAAYDHHLANAERYAARHDIAAYDDFARMVHEQGVEMVSVCTPHPLHIESIERAAALGVHVLCEKPLAATLQDCDRAIARCRAQGVTLGVVSQRRYYPPIQRMRAAIQAGKIGAPVLANMVLLGWRDEDYYAMNPWRGTWAGEGGGVMVNQAVHQLDLLQWLMGPVEELFGYWDNLNHPSVEVEDTALAVLRFRSGALGQFLVSNSQKPGFYGKIHIHGANGASVGAQPEGGSPFVAGVTTTVEAPINDIWTIAGEEHLLAQWQAEDEELARTRDTMGYYIQLQIEDFINALHAGREPLVNGEEGRKAVELFTAVYRAQRERAPVRFPLAAEEDGRDFDGRLAHQPYSQRDSNQ